MIFEIKKILRNFWNHPFVELILVSPAMNVVNVNEYMLIYNPNPVSLKQNVIK